MPSSAAERHAAPAGAGTLCSANAPCSLPQALNGAVADDEVVVHAGVHAIESAGGPGTHDVDVHGAAGEPRPEVRILSDTACGIAVGSGSRVAGLRVRPWVATAAAVCAQGDAIVEQLAIDSEQSQTKGVQLVVADGAIVRSVSIHLPSNGSVGIVAGGVRIVARDGAGNAAAAMRLSIRR